VQPSFPSSVTVLDATAYFSSGHPASIFGVGRIVPLNSSSDITLSLIRIWLSDCLRDHPKCHATGKGDRPARLVDLGSTCVGGDKIRLIDVQEETTPHLALSYCWGKTLPFTTTKASLNTRKAGITWANLPTTFQDAITLTRALGHRYIWIDALCIVQNDPADWERESAKMASIYQSAVLTISVAHGEDTAAGCFHDRHYSNSGCYRWDSFDKIVYRSPVGQDHVSFDYQASGDVHQEVHVSGSFYHDPVSDAREWASKAHYWARKARFWTSEIPGQREDKHPYPLFRRGWALQERLLSPRIIHIMRSEIFWECHTLLDCECGGIAFLDEGRKQQEKNHCFHAVLSRNTQEEEKLSQMKPVARGCIFNNPSTGLLAWQEIVVDYSEKELSCPSDKLPAISGLAHFFERPELGEYFAGIWAAELPLALLWEAADFEWLSVDRLSQKPYRAPSWSWASTDGRLKKKRFTSGLDFEHGGYIQAQVEEVCCTPLGLDSMGAVSSGHITLTAPFCRCLWKVDPPGARTGLNFIAIIDGANPIGSKADFENNIEPQSGHEDNVCITLSMTRDDKDNHDNMNILGPFYMLFIAASKVCEVDDLFSHSELHLDVCFEGLVLRKSESVLNAYERFGLFKIMPYGSKTWAGKLNPFKLTTVKIV
jgi:hypothetical protein